MRTGIVVLILLAILITTALSGCGGSASQPASQPETGEPAEQTELVLPEIAELRELSIADNRSCNGAEYHELLPHRNVAVDGDSLQFTPGGTISEPAYALFHLNVSMDETWNNLNFNWQSTGDYSQGWLGLANSETQVWDWLPFPQDNRFVHSFFRTEEDSSEYLDLSCVWIVLMFYGEPWELDTICFDDADIIEIDEIAPSDLRGYSGESLKFSAELSGLNPASYEWKFGGGATPNTTNDAAPEVVLGEPGTYTCRLIITAANGASDTLLFELEVLEAFPGWITVFRSYETELHIYGAEFSEVAAASNDDIYATGLLAYDTGMEPVYLGLLAKYSDQGEFLWARGWRYWSVGISARLVSIAVDDQDNVYAVGYYSGGYRPFVIAYNPNGDLLWANLVTDITKFIPTSLCVANNRLLATGMFNSSSWSVPDEAVLLEFNMQGEFQSCRAWSNDTDDFNFHDLCADPAGNVYVVGHAEIGSEPDSMLAMKLDNTGALTWCQGWAGGRINAVEYSGSLLYAAGGKYMSANMSYNPDVMVTCLDPDGAVQWTTCWGKENHDEEGTGLTILPDGSLALCGTQDPKYSSDYDYGPLLLSFTATGSFQWATGLTEDALEGFDITSTSDSGFVVAGLSPLGRFTSWYELAGSTQAATMTDSTVPGEFTDVPAAEFYDAEHEYRLEAQPDDQLGLTCGLLFRYDRESDEGGS